MIKRAGTPGTVLTAWSMIGVGVLGVMSSVAVAHPHEPPAGALDPGFGNGGVVLTPVNLVDSPGNLVVQEDGKIVVGGASESLMLFRYRRDGVPDPTYGTGGVASTPPGPPFPTLGGIALQRDGKVLAAGTIGQPDGMRAQIMLARFRHDGQLDDAFGTNGLVVTDIGPGNISRAAAVGVQADGRIVVVGLTSAGEGAGIGSNLLVRYERDGTLDQTFGVGGVATPDFGGAIGQTLLAIAFADDGKIVVAGSSKQAASGFNGSLARFNDDGTLDSTFGSGGVILSHLEGMSPFGSVVIQHDGRILVSGNKIARFLGDGELDSTFGVGGLASVPADQGGGIDTIRIDRCGRIVAAGTAAPGFLVLRYDRNGLIDHPTFGTGGATTTTVDGINLQQTSLALAPGGDIVVDGTGFVPSGPFSESLAVARYEADDDRGCECDRDHHW